MTIKIKNLLILLIIAISSAACSDSSDTNRPNVIFIMTDDVGYGDLGVYGAPDVRTPNIDELAREGARFTDFYANASVCSPTRAGFMTGRYQQRYGLEVQLSGPESAEGAGLNSDGNTLPHLLKNEGYVTGLIGKWHLGYEANQTPNAHGFDYFFGFKSGYVDYYQHTMGRTGAPDLWENNTPVTRDGYMVDLITEESVAFIKEHDDEPFFLSVQYNAAHWPFQPPDMPSVARNNAALLQPQEEDTATRADYVAIMERADQGVGEILAALEAAGLTEKTVVIFTNDNGGEWLSRNTPLFNRKTTLWEGGIRVPAIVKWPGTIPAGKISGQVGMTMDLMATILAATETAAPSSIPLDGINLLPMLTGEQPELERTLFWRTGSQKAVRSGDLKLVMNGALNTMVFNVRNDPGEREDLTNVSQDDALRMKTLLDEWEENVDIDSQGQ